MRIAIQDMQAMAKPEASLANEGEEHYFIEKKEKIGSSSFEVLWRKARVQGGDSFSLAEWW